MVNNSFYSNFRSLFNIELVKRLLSAIIFVPVFIFCLYQGGIFLISLFIFFFIIIFSELVIIFKLSNLKIGVALYILLATYTLSLSPFYYFSLDNNFFIFIYLLLSLWIFDTFSYLGGNVFRGKKIVVNVYTNLSEGATLSELISISLKKLGNK